MDNIEPLKKYIQERIRKSAERLYMEIVDSIENTINNNNENETPYQDTVEDTINDNTETEVSAIELAQQQEQYDKDAQEIDNTSTTPTSDDIKELKLNNKGGVNEDNVANRKALEELQARQKDVHVKQNGPHFKTIEEKMKHILKIVDYQFKRQEPIKNEVFKNAVLKYGLMKSEEYEETMIAFTVEGMAKAINGDNWFFMKEPIPKVEKKDDDKEQEPPIQSPISGITPVRATTDNEDDEDEYEDEYEEDEDDEYEDGEITNTEDEEDAEPIIKW